MTLGKISKNQIDKAQNILNELTKIIDKNEDCSEQSSEFYTYIPYSCGRKKPPLIDSKEKIGKYHELLDDLRNMIVAIKIIDAVNEKTDVNPLDAIYDDIGTTITPVDKDSNIWKHIEAYVKNTKGKTHNYQVELLDAFELHNTNRIKKYEEYCDKTFTSCSPNKHLLWHGSRISNFCSIIKKGLILNPESLGVVITGKMFGYGIYTANCISKSLNYCSVESSNNIGALLLCDVALGNPDQRLQADYYITKQKLEKNGYHSTKGIGQNTPGSVIEYDGIKIPNGPLKKINNKGGSLLYDEFIVYDTNQLNLHYLVLVKKI